MNCIKTTRVLNRIYFQVRACRFRYSARDSESLESGDAYGMASLAIQTLERKLLVYSSEREGGFKGVLQSAQDAEFAQVSGHLRHE